MSNSTSVPSGIPLDPALTSLYHYVPTEWICALFVALFSITTIIHTVQTAYYRIWWLIPTAILSGLLEVIGWSGRLWSSKNPSFFKPYLMQITTTIIAPTPLVGANFIILGQIIRTLGVRYSRLSANWYTILFLSCDLIALIVQAAGGGIAATAVQTDKDPANGGHIMLGGIVFQMAAIVCYVALASEFVYRYLKDKPTHKRDQGIPRTVATPRMKLMLFGMGLMTIFIFIRSVYRTIELSDGWTGKIISTQVLFNVLDGAMITLASFTLNIFHPGFLLKDLPSPSANVEATTIKTETEAKVDDKE